MHLPPARSRRRFLVNIGLIVATLPPVAARAQAPAPRSSDLERLARGSRDAKPGPSTDWDALVAPRKSSGDPASPPVAHLIPDETKAYLAETTLPADPPPVAAAGPDRSAWPWRDRSSLGRTATQQLLRAADEQIRQKHWAEALGLIAQARALDPTGLDVLKLRTNLYEAMHLPRHLIATYGEAIASHPEVATFWLLRGVLRCIEHDRGGLDDIDQGARLVDGPVVPMTTASLASFRCRALAALGDHGAALAAIDEAPASGPDDRIVRIQALADAGEFDRALAGVDALPSGEADSVNADRLRAYALINLGRCREALPVVARLLATNANESRIRFWHALALLGSGRVAEARGTVDALPVGWRKIEGFRCLDGWIALAEGDHARSYDLFDGLIARGNGMIRFHLAWRPMHLMQPFDDWAVVEFEERCRVVPALPFALMTRVGEAARSSDFPNPEFAVALVARTRADAALAPSFLLMAVVDHPDRTWSRYAVAGQVAAAVALGDRAKLVEAARGVGWLIAGPRTLREEIREEFGF